MAKWRKLSSEKEYNTALKRIDQLMDVKRTDEVHNELSLLALLVEAYEEEFQSLPDASPQEVIRFAMDMKNIKPQNLEPVLGTKGNVSKILNGKGNLRLEDIYPLSELLGIPMEALIPKTNTDYSDIRGNEEYANAPKVPIQKSFVNEPLPTITYSQRDQRTQRSAAAKKAVAKKKS